MQKSKLIGDFGVSGSDFASEEKFILKIVGEFVGRLRQKYNYSDNEVNSLLQKNELMVPIEIFSSGLAPAEALAKFLKENHDKNFHEISLLTNKNEKSIWQNYHRAIKKMPSNFSIDSKIKIPASAFNNKRLSVFECLIFYLKGQKQMKNAKIAKLLGRHPANVWSVYSRAAKKVKRGFKK